MSRWSATRFLALALASAWGLVAGADVSPAPAVPEESDAVRAWREAVAGPNTNARAKTLRALAPAVAEPDPRSALLLADTLGGLERDILIDAAWTAWGRQDAQAALAGLEELPELGIRDTCLAHTQPVYRVVEGWTQADPRAVFAWAAANDKSAFLDVALRAIAESDVAEALGLAEQLADRLRRDAFAAVLHVWAQSDPHAAAAWLEDAAPEDAAGAFFLVAWAWASISPAQALDWAHTLPAHIQVEAIPIVIGSATQASPDTASELLARIHDPKRRSEATEPLVARWSVSAPRDARRWIAHAVDDEARGQLYVNLFASWAERDRESAANELREIANPQHRDAATLAILHTTAHDLRVSAEMARREGQPAETLRGDIDFAEELYGGILGAETQQEAAKLLYDTFDDVAPERAERYRVLAGVIESA